MGDVRADVLPQHERLLTARASPRVTVSPAPRAGLCLVVVRMNTCLSCPGRTRSSGELSAQKKRQKRKEREKKLVKWMGPVESVRSSHRREQSPYDYDLLRTCQSHGFFCPRYLCISQAQNHVIPPYCVLSASWALNDVPGTLLTTPGPGLSLRT